MHQHTIEFQTYIHVFYCMYNINGMVYGIGIGIHTHIQHEVNVLCQHLTLLMDKAQKQH